MSCRYATESLYNGEDRMTGCGIPKDPTVLHRKFYVEEHTRRRGGKKSYKARIVVCASCKFENEGDSLSFVPDLTVIKLATCLAG